MLRALCSAVLIGPLCLGLFVGCSPSPSRGNTPPSTGTAGAGGSGGSSGDAGSGGAAASNGGVAGSTDAAGSGGGTESSGTAGSSGSAGSSGTAGSGGTGGANDAAGSGGGAGSGGSAGSGNADAGASDGSATACSGYQLCDDFETTNAGDPGSAWTIIKNEYVVETVTTKAHSGTHSVHVMATTSSGYGYIEETKTFPATDWWGRAFLLLQAPSGGHEVFAGADTDMNEASGEQVRFLNNLGGGKVSTNRRSDDMSKTSSTSIPMGAWFCFEWHEAPTALSVFVNGTDLTDADEAWTEPTFVSLVLGFERFESGTAGDIWIDDVAVNSTRVGCN